MDQSERLERAHQLALALAEPPADRNAGRALASRRSQLTMFRIAWVAMFAFMLVGGASAGFSIMAALWLVVVIAIFGFGWTSIRRELEQIERRMASPLEREAVTILDKQARGRYRVVYVTVADRAGRRRELAAPDQPGLLIPGDVGVLFSRADAVWSFHRVD